MKTIFGWIIYLSVYFIVVWYICIGLSYVFIEVKEEINPIEVNTYIDRLTIKEDKYKVWCAVRVNIDGESINEYYTSNYCTKDQIDSIQGIQLIKTDSVVKVLRKILDENK